MFDEKLVLITRRDDAPVRSPRNLRDTMLLVFRTGCSYRRRLKTWFESAGVAPGRTLEFGTFQGIVGCVAAGMGVSLMPRVLIEDRRLRDSIGVHAVPARIGGIATMLVWHRDAEPHAAREAFLEVMQEAGPRRVEGNGRQRARDVA